MTAPYCVFQKPNWGASRHLNGFCTSECLKNGLKCCSFVHRCIKLLLKHLLVDCFQEQELGEISCYEKWLWQYKSIFPLMLFKATAKATLILVALKNCVYNPVIGGGTQILESFYEYLVVNWKQTLLTWFQTMPPKLQSGLSGPMVETFSWILLPNTVSQSTAACKNPKKTGKKTTSAFAQTFPLRCLFSILRWNDTFFL